MTKAAVADSLGLTLRSHGRDAPVVVFVEPTGCAAGSLLFGDRVLSVNGVQGGAIATSAAMHTALVLVCIIERGQGALDEAACLVRRGMEASKKIKQSTPTRTAPITMEFELEPLDHYKVLRPTVLHGTI